MEPDERTWKDLVAEAHQRGERAARRAAEAHRRAAEIQKLRESAGEGRVAVVSDSDTAERAAAHAGESRQRSAVAHRSAARGHQLAEKAHERAIDVDAPHAAEHEQHARWHHDAAERAVHEADEEG
ncbi:hypothetical protein [Actinoplanes sp. NPDC023714]|uniref:hypothetical protein n=1 Tax=Actinoplanes sp. NPDC023714 TaxID=3154322 RepID=UPI0033D17683